MGTNDKRCLNVKSAVDRITTTDPHPYRLCGSVLERRDLFGYNGMLDAFITMISRCFIKQRYFFDRENDPLGTLAEAGPESSAKVTTILMDRLKKLSWHLQGEWWQYFGQHHTSINWEKFCAEGIMEMQAPSLLTSAGDVPYQGQGEGQRTVTTGLMPDTGEGSQYTSSRYLDAVFNDFHALCNRHLRGMTMELDRTLSIENRTTRQRAMTATAAVFKTSLSFDDTRIVCLVFRDLCQLDALIKKLHQARRVLAIDDPCHLIEYERHVHALFITKLDAYTRLLMRYHSDTGVRDWAYVAEFFSGVHARAIERYDKATLISSVLRGMVLTQGMPHQWNRDLLTLHVSLLHRQIRVFFVHDLVMRYFIRRYFTKTSNPKFTVHPFEKREPLDDERIRFFVWLVNRSLVNDGCYEWRNAVDDAEFWRKVLAHCATLSPSTFIGQIFKYVASLEARVPITVHDLLDYVEWLCAYDPWYLCYSNAIVERFRLFSENKLQKQFSAFYESECVLFFILVGNRLPSVDEKVKFLRDRPELRIFAGAAASDDPGNLQTMFDYSGHLPHDHPLPSTPLPIFNWFNLSSNVFNYGVYYETLDWCAKTVQDYFIFARGEMNLRSRQSSASSLSAVHDATLATLPHRAASSCAMPRDSLNEMISRASGAKRARYANDSPAMAFPPARNRLSNAQVDSNPSHSDEDDSHEGRAADYFGIVNDSGQSPHQADSMPPLERVITNKSFTVSLLQNCMNFLNDICLMYNGDLMHKGGAENKHSYNQANFKDRLKQSNDAWKSDKRLVVYRITWNDLDLHKLEESCYREKSKDRLSKAIGNTLASCSTSQINVNYLRFRHDGKHAYVIFNVMLRRYEIAAPSLMYLLSLDYKNWHLNDNDCYPSSVDPRVRDYTAIALNEIDAFVDAVVSIDALSMMLNCQLIREKRIGANNAITLLDKQMGMREGNKHSDKVSPSASHQPNDVSSGGDQDSIEKETDTRITAPAVADVDNDSRRQRSEPPPLWSHAASSLDDSGEDKSYVDFILDRTEFFELSQTIPPQWIYRYVEQLLRDDNDRTFVHIILLIVQIVHHYGLAVLERESFATLVTEELLLCALPPEHLVTLRKRKKTTVSNESGPKSEILAHQRSKNSSHVAAEAGDRRHPGNSKRSDLSRFMEQQFQTCLALSDQVINCYRSSYRREPVHSGASSHSLTLGQASRQQDASTAISEEEITWHDIFKEGDGETPAGSRHGRSGSIVRDLLVEQDMRHFLSSTLHSEKFYQWLRSRNSTIKLEAVIDLGDQAFVRLFAVFIYVIRVITRQQSRSVINNKATTHGGNTSGESASLADHIMRHARRILHELHLAFPCRFVTSRSTVNLSDAFVDYLDRRIVTACDHRSKKKAASPNNLSTAENPTHLTNQQTSAEENNDPFSCLLRSLDNEHTGYTGVLSSPLNKNQGHADDPLSVRNIPYLRESSLAYQTRQSISYFLFFIYIFCNCDISVTLYMLRFLASLLYPGPWAKTIAIIQGSSNSGKSNMVNLIRYYYNSAMAVLNPRVLSGPKDNIGTEFLPMSENFVCQVEELKEVEAETIKTMTSDTPLQSRSFHSQRQQTVGILASMVITLNQMFRVVSDEGVLERLRVIFRVTHRHLELVRKESDMTRVNCGASMNVSHQFIRSVFPRGIVPELFQRGMFYTMMNWCSSQVTSPEDRFIHADRVASRYLHTLLTADIPSLQSVHELAAERNLSDLETSQELTRRWQDACVMQESLGSPGQIALSMAKIIQHMDKSFQCQVPSPTSAALLSRVTEPTSRNMIERYLLHVDSFKCLLNTTPLRLEMRVLYARQYTNCVVLYEPYSYLFNKLASHDDLMCYLTHMLSDSHRDSAQVTRLLERVPLPCVNDDEYDDNHVNLMVKPYILDLYLADLHANIDSFVRFQNTYKVTSSDAPINKESLQYQLKIFVDRFNATIPDSKYRVKFNEFFDRFETEYEKFKYRDSRTNQIVPNLWAIRVRPLAVN